MPQAIHWLPKAAKHDYAAAGSYLSLNLDEKTVERVVKELADADGVTFKAKDILRASGLPLLPRDNPDVVKEIARITAGEALSPCLLVRGHLEKGRLAQIADGYHRVCAVNHVDEDADVPVQITGL